MKTPVALMTQGVYGTQFIIGWTLFALCSPVLAALAWKSKEKGVFSVVIRVGIVAVSILSSILLFHRLRIYDLVIEGILIYILFSKKFKGTELYPDQTKEGFHDGGGKNVRDSKNKC